MAHPHRLTDIVVDPDLFDVALSELAHIAEESGEDIHMVVVAGIAYADWAGIDAEPGEDALRPEEIDTIAALGLRLSAFAELLSSGRFQVEADDEAMRRSGVEAACVATLFEAEGRTSFHLLDFLNRLPRRKAPRK